MEEEDRFQGDKLLQVDTSSALTIAGSVEILYMRWIDIRPNDVAAPGFANPGTLTTF